MKRSNTVVLLLLLLLCSGSGSAEEWWESANVYQIYPRSFRDSNGDGIGDLRGITQQLPYLQEIGITAVWLSPIYKSPLADMGYDISDLRDIHPDYGTLADFANMVTTCQELGLRLLLDFVPNHTSDEHEWFVKSVQRVEPYTDYYIWHPGKLDANNVRSPPNNWLSAFRFSGWEWNADRGEYYFHQFAVKQPDLNYRNADVVSEMSAVLVYWLDLGVSGFRVDAVPHLFEVQANAQNVLPDEPPSGQCANDPDAFCYLNHIYTQNQPETFQWVYQMRALLDSYATQNQRERPILLTEAYVDLNYLMQFYQDSTGTLKGSQVPFNFELLLHVNGESTAKDFKTYIDRWLDAMPVGSHANWVLGNHDNHRIASRFGTSKIDLLNILLKTLPGIAITYMGEELGMTNVHVSWADTLDPQACNTNPTIYHENSRDPARTPFQWDATVNAGFSKSTTNKMWLPVSPNYKNINVASQELSPRSHLKVFKKLIAARNDGSLRTGGFDAKLFTDDVLVYKREAQGSNPYVIVLNFGKTEQTINLSSLYTTLPANLRVVTSSILSQYTDGVVVPSARINIRPDHGVVFTVA